MNPLNALDSDLMRQMRCVNRHYVLSTIILSTYWHVSQDDMYEVRVIRDGILGTFSHVNRQPHFKVNEMLKKPKFRHVHLVLPDSRFLAFHAVCARVAHMPGAAEYFNDLEWDAEDTMVVTEDSVKLLYNLLSPIRRHTCLLITPTTKLISILLPSILFSTYPYLSGHLLHHDQLKPINSARLGVRTIANTESECSIYRSSNTTCSHALKDSTEHRAVSSLPLLQCHKHQAHLPALLNEKSRLPSRSDQSFLQINSIFICDHALLKSRG
ncbi:uncharacterized protein C8R40DRAFT_235045 [Lentinula edodes]|uniref:uncharacterized protein n=1 Tax=Lentinula edodes TaxID=5353 RepID=UPI001E8E3959|nr:uncharacterized protein C8R40DRAFT_235045 [Lentinula edodes]KAH7874900.1 hypothetical protein C8R40DRAFT_235045 [Lentinula edodes]